LSRSSFFASGNLPINPAVKELHTAECNKRSRKAPRN